ncbi:MAG: glycosyltransferase family A protein [Actinomycetota bacterium]
MSEPDLTVILPTRNGGDWLEDALEALAEQRWDGSWEIVFVDNDSDDETPQLLAAAVDTMPVPARLVTATEHHNLSHARNTGVDAARGRSVAFVDDDDLIADGWVAAMGEALHEHEFVASAFDYHRLNPAGVAEARGSFQTVELGDLFGKPIVSGGGSGCRRALWHQLGGNSQTFPATGQDMDFALRVAALGTVTPHFCAGARYHVRLRDGARTSFRQGRKYGRWSVRLFRLHGAPAGERADSPSRMIRRWGGLMRRSGALLDRHRRLAWMWQAGQRVGRLQGSLAERTWYP